ncbi:YdaS family helix-turn-helix protein [Luteibacter sp.]|uniref:YdaS family helix-turn-helix protein n=1 Tax=Luteibacter sp. TaxID=1886636 RepID=UPI0025C5F045|nr:YdaS family helix-turn-helix protein [Luteibacter sp.]
MTPEQILEATGLPTIREVVRVTGVTAQAVYKWRRIPSEHCLAIEAANEGRRTRYQMRPDVYGRAPRGTKPRKKAA